MIFIVEISVREIKFMIFFVSADRTNYPVNQIQTAVAIVIIIIVIIAARPVAFEK